MPWRFKFAQGQGRSKKIFHWWVNLLLYRWTENYITSVIFFCIFGRDESKRSLSCCTVFLDLLAFKNVLKDCLHMPTRRSCCRSFPLLSSRECLPVHDCYYHHHYHRHHYCYHYYYCYYFIFSLISFWLSHLQIFRFAILREKKGNLYKDIYSYLEISCRT